uniref:Opsin 9 n=1 Tax=Amphiprion percula TaxID=161767 RepID=A0A3P8SV75_AMPPE
MGHDASQRGSWFVPSSVQLLFISRLSPSADVAVAVFLIFTGIASVLGNGLVLLVFCRRRKKLRPPELLTINLALCDFGFSLLGSPFFIISSLCHAWVFGEAGCLWYGVQGFVFGIGSLITTSLISMDRCLKICCLRYGQWIERRHVFWSIAVVWFYASFWATLPVFGFGSYGPEPYGLSCTINWWSLRSSENDRIYVILILTLCFGFPTFTIISSYLFILLTVLRSNRTLASIPSSFVSNSSKDLRLAKMAAVVCSTFLLAWLPYASVSLISALREAESSMEEPSGSAVAPDVLDSSSLLNWTRAEFYRQVLHSPEDRVEPSPPLGTRPVSSLPPVVTLIPAMLAKSHCMINPLIYQIMNREFRDDVYAMVFGREKAERRRAQSRRGSLYERTVSLSYCQSWSRRSTPISLSGDRKNRNLKRLQDRSSDGRTKSGNISEGADGLDVVSLDTRGNMKRHSSVDRLKTSRDLRGSTSSILTV